MELAKPTLYISIEDHTKNVINEAQEILASRPFYAKKYKKITGKDLKKRLVTAAKYHDIGKKHPIWQKACKEDYEIFRKTNNPLMMYHLRNANFRHEIASLLHNGLDKLSEPVKVSIVAHHGKLAESESHKWEDEKQGGKVLWKSFKGLKNKLIYEDKPNEEKFQKSILLRYEFSGPRSLLQLADHRASAKEMGEILPELKLFHYSFPYENKRGVQLIIENLKDELFSILRAPTGSGKTDAALLWAKYQIEMERADRLIIAMPTRFTANALSINVAENLSQVGLYHSSAWFQRTNNKTTPIFNQKNIDKEQELARLLITPITVTTIDHLCISLTGTREDHHSIFFNMAHSCIVIDEADFYDELTQHNILILLNALRLLKVPVLLISATVPDNAQYFYSKFNSNLVKIYEDKSESERVRCKIIKYRDYSEPNELKELLLRGLSGTPMIIYANTVSRAQEYYKWFQNQSEEFTKNNVVLYHSRFTEPDKVKIEERLSNMLGKKAWECGNQYGVAILTQIGELSVNISSDLMISDICPIDRLVQRIGRLSRFRQNVGELFVVNPLRKNKNNVLEFYPAPYGCFTKNGWKVSHALKATEELLCNGYYTSNQFVELVNKVYKLNAEISSSAKNNMKEYQNLIINNWLILPADQLDIDDDHTNEWKCRDIDPQITIYVNVDLSFGFEQYFSNMSEFRQFQIRHGVLCYRYEFCKALKNGYIEKAIFYIGERKKHYHYIVRPKFYNPHMGLYFEEIND